jgi:Pyruvate/2-oxoacid:ferredoxin oxidoreductase delta subunit
MVVNAVGDGKRVAFNLDKVMRGEPLQPRTIPVDVIFDLNRMNMTYFPHFPRVHQADAAPATSRKKTQDEVIQAFSEEQAVEEANRCFSCGTCNACDNCYLVCPEPCIARPSRSNGCTKFWSTTAKVAACASRNVPRDASKACLNSTSIRAWCEWIRHSPSRRAAWTAGGRAEKSGGSAGERTFRERSVNHGNIAMLQQKKTVRINGCVASAQAAKYADVDVIAAYPIRPYTATMMALAQMVANGELDAEYIVADSEHSQLSIAHGAHRAARAFSPVARA